MNTDSAEEVSEIPEAPPLPQPMPRGSVQQTTNDDEPASPEVNDTSSLTSIDTTPNIPVTDKAFANSSVADAAVSKETVTPLPIGPRQCQNINWVVTPDKETYRTVLVNYHFQNCQSGGGCCRNGANAPGSLGKCSCPETACCTRRNRERKDFEAFMKERKEIEANLAAAGKPNLETFIFSDGLSKKEKVESTKKNKVVVLVDGDGNVITDEPAESNVEEAEGGAVCAVSNAVSIPVPNAVSVTDGAGVSKEVGGSSRPAKSSRKPKENANEKSARAKAGPKRSDIQKQQQMELHRWRVAVELRKLELLQFKIERERQEMDRAKILFEKQLEMKGHVDLRRDDADV